MCFQSLLQKRTLFLILYGVKYENDNERNVFRYKSWSDVTVQVWTHTINSSVTKSSVRAARPAQLQVRSGNLFLRKKREEEEKKLKCTQTDLYANNAGLSWWLMASLSAHFRSNKHRNISFSSLLERHRRKVGENKWLRDSRCVVIYFIPSFPCCTGMLAKVLSEPAFKCCKLTPTRGWLCFIVDLVCKVLLKYGCWG